MTRGQCRLQLGAELQLAEALVLEGPKLMEMRRGASVVSAHGKIAFVDRLIDLEPVDMAWEGIKYIKDIKGILPRLGRC